MSLLLLLRIYHACAVSAKSTRMLQSMIFQPSIPTGAIQRPRVGIPTRLEPSLHHLPHP